MRTWWLVLMSRSSRDSATTGFGNNGYQSIGLRFEVRISGPVVHGPIGDEFVEIVGLGCGVLPEGEVVQDEDGRAGVLADPGAPGAVGVAAGEVGQDSAGFGEPDLAAAAGDEVSERLRDMGFSDSDRARRG